MKLKVSQTIANGVEVEKKVAVCRVSPFDTGVGAVQLATITAKGDILAGTASAAIDNVAVGADGTVLTADSTQTAGVKFASVSANVPMRASGRLTLETGVPVSTADQTAKTTLYHTPFIGQQIPLYYNATWNLHTFTEQSVALTDLTASVPYDVFRYLDGSTLRLALTQWTNTTTRASAIAMLNGIYVNSAAMTPTQITGLGIPGAIAQYGATYVGTIGTTGTTGQCEDSVLNRFVWNAYNRVRRTFRVVDATNTWAYLTATWRSWNNSAAARVSFVNGLNEDPVYLNFVDIVASTGGFGYVGIALDATNANSASITTPAATYMPAIAIYNGLTGIGYHYLQLVENGNGLAGCNFYGDGGEVMACGATGWIMG